MVSMASRVAVKYGAAERTALTEPDGVTDAGEDRDVNLAVELPIIRGHPPDTTLGPFTVRHKRRPCAMRRGGGCVIRHWCGIVGVGGPGNFSMSGDPAGRQPRQYLTMSQPLFNGEADSKEKYAAKRGLSDWNKCGPTSCQHCCLFSV
jgi:hypothetical protein